MRPILEYASAVWDNGTMKEKETLQKVQIEAARIVSGVTRSITLSNLYKGISWLKLDDRRKYQKLILIYKIINGLAPQYLNNIFPLPVNSRTDYALRNANQIDLVVCRTDLHAKFFIPSAVSLWNELPDDLKSSPSLSLFKYGILQTFSVSQVPRHYFVGERKFSVLQPSMRNNCSDLKFDLFFQSSRSKHNL